MASQKLTAADFYEGGEYESCFHVYAWEYHHLGNNVCCAFWLRDVGAVSPENDRAKVVLEQAFPLLAASWMRFDIGYRGGLIFHQHEEEMPEGAYDEWRFFSCAIFDEAPEVLRRSGFDLRTMHVEPLPGPWKWQFL